MLADRPGGTSGAAIRRFAQGCRRGFRPPLLDGLKGEDRAARERLLERLAGEGFTLEELKAAIDEDRLALLLGRARARRPLHRQRSSRSEPGCRPTQMLRIRRLLGCPRPRPEERVFGEEEIDAAKSISLFLESGLGEDSIAEITRVLGEGMARLAATTAAAFVEAFLEPGDSEDEVAERFATLAEQLIPAIDPVLRAAYKQHLAESVRRGMLSPAERESGEAGGAQEITVCFVDMVGFTRLGAQIEPQELGQPREQAGRARQRRDRSLRCGSSRRSATPRCSSAPTRRRWCRSRCRCSRPSRPPTCRASGRASRAGRRCNAPGDYYGHAVNLASRVTGVARPGSVLCTQEVHDAAPDRFDWSFARKHKLKGMSEPVSLYRARRLARRDARASAQESQRRGRRRRGAGEPTPATNLRRNRKQIDDEHERRVRRDRRGAARLAVGEARRDDQLAPAADLHAGDSLHPARDHAAVA